MSKRIRSAKDYLNKIYAVNSWSSNPKKLCVFSAISSSSWLFRTSRDPFHSPLFFVMGKDHIRLMYRNSFFDPECRKYKMQTVVELSFDIDEPEIDAILEADRLSLSINFGHGDITKRNRAI